MGTLLTLPGGAWVDGELVRVAALRTLTGRVEQRIAAFAGVGSAPERVTNTLAAALEHIGHQKVTAGLAGALSVPDRQFLMLAIALETGADQKWQHLTCAACGALFDIGFRLSDIPLTWAGAGYPWAEVMLGGRAASVRVPTGEDETCVADLAPEAAFRALALRCVSKIEGNPPSTHDLEQLGAEDLATIDAALDSMAPQLGTRLSTMCHECGAAHTVEIDPYSVVETDVASLYRDVHALALSYHWSEPQCLRLSRDRRRMYLSLLEQELDLER